MLYGIFTTDPAIESRMRGFFQVRLRNQNSRARYIQDLGRFADYCDANGITALTEIKRHHITLYVRTQLQSHSPSAVRGQLTAIRSVFDWLVTSKLLPSNPAERIQSLRPFPQTNITTQESGGSIGPLHAIPGAPNVSICF